MAKWTPRVYISGPITKGDRIANYTQALNAERELMLKGFAPLNPMRSMALPHAWGEDMPHELWLQTDLPWVEVADAVLRLPGESKGATEECDYADAKDVPVFLSMADLLNYFGDAVKGTGVDHAAPRVSDASADYVVVDSPLPAAKLPTDAADRKATPIATGVLDYFPLALAEVARTSKAGNDQHNPGHPLHWDKTKSTDHADCIVRHLIDRGALDGDGQRHSAKVAWRALALLQTELEHAIGA